MEAAPARNEWGDGRAYVIVNGFKFHGDGGAYMIQMTAHPGTGPLHLESNNVNEGPFFEQ